MWLESLIFGNAIVDIQILNFTDQAIVACVSHKQFSIQVLGLVNEILELIFGMNFIIDPLPLQVKTIGFFWGTLMLLNMN